MIITKLFQLRRTSTMSLIDNEVLHFADFNNSAEDTHVGFDICMFQSFRLHVPVATTPPFSSPRQLIVSPFAPNYIRPTLICTG